LDFYYLGVFLEKLKKSRYNGLASEREETYLEMLVDSLMMIPAIPINSGRYE